jgi:hypothetical protein
MSRFFARISVSAGLAPAPRIKKTAAKTGRQHDAQRNTPHPSTTHNRIFVP